MNGFEKRSAKKREEILATALKIINHPDGINLPLFLKLLFLNTLKLKKI